MSTTNLNNLKKADLIALIETERQSAALVEQSLNEAMDELLPLRARVAQQAITIEQLQDSAKQRVAGRTDRSGFVTFAAFCQEMAQTTPLAKPGQLGLCLLDPEHGTLRANVYGVCPKCATAGHAACVAEARSLKAAA